MRLPVAHQNQQRNSSSSGNTPLPQRSAHQTPLMPISRNNNNTSSSSTPIHHASMNAPVSSSSGNQSNATGMRSAEQNPHLQELRNFLANAPRLWSGANDAPVRKLKLSNGEEIACVYWQGRFFITGTDVVKILTYRFQQLGRGILNPKKFEEGVFSDLRNLKAGTDAVLEEPRSEFLEFLHKNGCIRTQKKQKVFYWNKVPHDDLFREAMERNLKRVANVFNWSNMINSPELVKQYMMMHSMAAVAAAAAATGGNPTAMMLSNPNFQGARWPDMYNPMMTMAAATNSTSNNNNATSNLLMPPRQHAMSSSGILTSMQQQQLDPSARPMKLRRCVSSDDLLNSSPINCIQKYDTASDTSVFGNVLISSNISLAFDSDEDDDEAVRKTNTSSIKVISDKDNDSSLADAPPIYPNLFATGDEDNSLVKSTSALALSKEKSKNNSNDDDDLSLMLDQSALEIANLEYLEFHHSPQEDEQQSNSTPFAHIDPLPSLSSSSAADGNSNDPLFDCGHDKSGGMQRGGVFMDPQMNKHSADASPATTSALSSPIATSSDFFWATGAEKTNSMMLGSNSVLLDGSGRVSGAQDGADGSSVLFMSNSIDNGSSSNALLVNGSSSSPSPLNSATGLATSHDDLWSSSAWID